jgi:hypothetical protein
VLAGSSLAVVGGRDREEVRLREVIEGEVLDRRPSVHWKDIAGLAGAKQVFLSSLLVLFLPQLLCLQARRRIQHSLATIA